MTEEEAAAFERHRPHLLSVAYRITGSLADAEDAAQEAWLRFARLDHAARAELRDVRAWLATVVGRIGLDRLRSAAVRREQYVGPWLPEPLVTTGEDDPLTAVVRDEGVRMAAMVVLERLSPAQRVAFVLREALELPYVEIGEVLGCPEATARQHVARARRVMADAAPPPRAPTAEQKAVLAAFADALARADARALADLLHPDVVMLNDSDGKAPAARRPVVGADKVTRLLLGLKERYGPSFTTGWEPVLVNGELGVRTPPSDELPATVGVFVVTGGRVFGIYQVVNPEKLTRS